MYVPEHFKETRIKEIHRIITEYPLGMLVWNGPDGLDANHLPFELDPNTGGQGYLLAHVARANPVWQEVQNGDQVMVVFRGESGYISPNWYPSKHEFHRQVPTWNYQAVHIHGNITVRDDEKFVRGAVARLSRMHEARANDKPWKMKDAPAEYIDQMLAAIVGIEIEITQLVGKSKLSQNRETRDRLNVVRELSRRDKHAMATAILNAGRTTD